MDSESLVRPEDIEIGRKALEALSADADLKVRAAMWMFNDNLRQWLFTIATPYYEKHGAQAAYLRVRKIIDKNSLLGKLPLDRVSIIADADPILGLIRMAFGSPSDSYIINCMVNNTELPNVYIYRIEKQRAGTRKGDHAIR